MATVSLWLSSLYAKGSGLRIGDEIVMFFVPGAWLVSAFELVIRSLIRDVVSCKDIGTCRNTGLDAQSGSPLSFLLHQAKTVPAEEQQQTYHMPRESKNVHVSHNHYGGGGVSNILGDTPKTLGGIWLSKPTENGILPKRNVNMPEHDSQQPLKRSSSEPLLGKCFGKIRGGHDHYQPKIKVVFRPLHL